MTQGTDHQATDHQATDHQATDHQATDHQATDHQATAHAPLADHAPPQGATGLIELAGLIERMSGLGWQADSQDIMRACHRLSRTTEPHISPRFVLEMAEIVAYLEHGDDTDAEVTRRIAYIAEACQYYNGSVLAGLCSGNLLSRDGSWRTADLSDGREAGIGERARRIRAHYARVRLETFAQQGLARPQGLGRNPVGTTVAGSGAGQVH